LIHLSIEADQPAKVPLVSVTVCSVMLPAESNMFVKVVVHGDQAMSSIILVMQCAPLSWVAEISFPALS
jgi:hypothetical protein